MFIAHGPAGYLLAKTVYRDRGKNQLILILITVAASLAPDLDLLYFYLIDHRAHNHHSYWPHIPFYWLLIYCLAIGVAVALNAERFLAFASAAFLGVGLHLFLDTITGGIRWIFPFSNKYYAFVDIPAVYSWWVLNFLLHWTFLLEIILVLLACYQIKFAHSLFFRSCDTESIDMGL